MAALVTAKNVHYVFFVFRPKVKSRNLNNWIPGKSNLAIGDAYERSSISDGFSLTASLFVVQIIVILCIV